MFDVCPCGPPIPAGDEITEDTDKLSTPYVIAIWYWPLADSEDVSASSRSQMSDHHRSWSISGKSRVWHPAPSRRLVGATGRRFCRADHFGFMFGLSLVVTILGPTSVAGELDPQVVGRPGILSDCMDVGTTIRGVVVWGELGALWRRFVGFVRDPDRLLSQDMLQADRRAFNALMHFLIRNS